MYPSYIHLVESLANARPDEVPQYSWGSAVLCATYRGLCDASQRSTGGEPVLAVCYTLLQQWSWQHFLVGRPYFRSTVHPFQLGVDLYGNAGGDDPVDGPTMGTRWTRGTLGWARERPRRVYPEFHNLFETLHEDEVIWWPWTAQFLADTAPYGLSSQCTQDETLWLTTCHLVFSHMVEPYNPQRVMRQFGLYQEVPPLPGRPLTEKAHRYVIFRYHISRMSDLHFLRSEFNCRQTRRGRRSDDWRQTQQPWTTLWGERAATDMVHELRGYAIQTYAAYLQWYVPRTRCRLTGPAPQRPVEVMQDAVVLAGPDRHRVARHDETVKHSS